MKRMAGLSRNNGITPEEAIEKSTIQELIEYS